MEQAGWQATVSPPLFLALYWSWVPVSGRLQVIARESDVCAASSICLPAFKFDRPEALNMDVEFRQPSSWVQADKLSSSLIHRGPRPWLDRSKAYTPTMGSYWHSTTSLERHHTYACTMLIIQGAAPSLVLAPIQWNRGIASIITITPPLETIYQAKA